MCLFCCLSSLFFSLSPSALPKFSLSPHLRFSLLFFLPVQEMAHILAQKQLRSIILSVSLTMPFSSTHPPSQLCVSLSVCLCLALSLVGVMPLYQSYIRKENDTCHFCLSLVTGYYLLYLFSHTCSHFVPFMLSCVLNLISVSPVPSSDLCFLILLIHSQILLFSFISCCLPTKSIFRLSDPKTRPHPPSPSLCTSNTSTPFSHLLSPARLPPSSAPPVLCLSSTPCRT